MGCSSQPTCYWWRVRNEKGLNVLQLKNGTRVRTKSAKWDLFVKKCLFFLLIIFSPATVQMQHLYPHP